MSSIVPQKQCTKCKKYFPSTTQYFSADKQKKDGLRPDCKLCNQVTQSKSRIINAENIKEGRFIRYHSGLENDYEGTRQKQKTERDNRKEYFNKYSNNYYHAKKQTEPNKLAARKAVKQAIESDLLTVIKNCKCQLCGKQAQHYHHWNYRQSHWLDVIPLCAVCHKKEHVK